MSKARTTRARKPAVKQTQKKAVQASSGSRRHRHREPTHQRIRYTAIGPVITNLGYGSAKTLRESGRSPATGGSGDAHLRYDLEEMRDESQRFDRNNGIYQGMITRAIDCILGSGMTLQAKTKSKSTNDTLEKLWRDWWSNPEVRGLHEGAAIERLALRHLFVDGDVAAYKLRKSQQIQLIEAERINTLTYKTLPNGNRIEAGVEVDRLGKPVRFHVSDYDPSGYIRTDAKRIPARDIVYMANCQRISQTRGVPIQQSNFPMFHRINDVCDSEAIAWQLLSRFAVAIIRKDAEAIAQATSELDENASDADIASRYHDVGDAVIFHGQPGEDIHGIDRSIPGANFVESMKMFLRLLGLPFGFPLEFVLLIWSDTTFSSGRASVKQVERACKPWIRLFKNRFMGPLYRWKVGQWIYREKIPKRDDVYSHNFHAEPYPFLDPVKEEHARKLRLGSGSTSPTREAKEAGLDLAELIAEQESDLSLILKAIERLNKKFPGAGITLADMTGFVQQRRPATPTTTQGSPR